jgi:hypothetical protein
MEKWRRFSGVPDLTLGSCLFCLAAALALVAVGCSGVREKARRQGLMRVVTPHPPSFLTGPASVLLTNSGGFSAWLEVQAQSTFETDRASSGQLLGRGTKLLYAPESDETTDTHHKPGGYSFIWDVAESKGYVLSEALQGYAPVSAVLHVTNVAIDIGQSAAQRISGHPCESARATVRMLDGSSAGFELFRAIDLNGFPIKIESATNAMVFTLNLSKIRIEQPQADIFSPPEGFTKYPTPEAMADELAARQNNLRRRNPYQLQAFPEMERGRY